MLRNASGGQQQLPSQTRPLGAASYHYPHPHCRRGASPPVAVSVTASGAESDLALKLQIAPAVAKVAVGAVAVAGLLVVEVVLTANSQSSLQPGLYHRLMDKWLQFLECLHMCYCVSVDLLCVSRDGVLQPRKLKAQLQHMQPVLKVMTTECLHNSNTYMLRVSWLICVCCLSRNNTYILGVFCLTCLWLLRMVLCNGGHVVQSMQGFLATTAGQIHVLHVLIIIQQILQFLSTKPQSA